MRWPQFKPSNTTGVLTEGVMGRALEVSPIELCGSVFLANHYHLLAVVHEQQELSRFMQHLACNLSKEVGRIRDWSGPMWARRYAGIVVSDEPEAQWARLKYLLSNSVKEGLCASPFDWPGVHSARALVSRARSLRASGSIGRRNAEASMFPEGCYPPALPFTGSPASLVPPAPPTRWLILKGKKVVERGPVPVVEPPVRIWMDEPRARGHPV